MGRSERGSNGRDPKRLSSRVRAGKSRRSPALFRVVCFLCACRLLASPCHREPRLTVSHVLCTFLLSSGIGLQAARLLIESCHGHRLILVCRNEERAQQTVEAAIAGVSKQSVAAACVIPMTCDHTRLKSVRQFAKDLPTVLEETFDAERWSSNGIDVLCLNAAVLHSKTSLPSFTEDGLETTFQTNHLSPFLIAYLTGRLLNAGGRVIVSTSGLYLTTNLRTKGMVDPSTKAAIKGFEMIDGSQFHFKRSYTLAKVCNVALVRCLQRRLSKRHVVVSCFSPGLMTSSGLFRNQTEHDLEASMAHKEIARMNEKSVSWGGGALVYMALAPEVGQQEGVYWSDRDSRTGDNAVYGAEFCSATISEEALSTECTEDLWRICCELADVPSHMTL